MRRIGRYVLHDQIASGGMAAVHLGRVRGDEGFERTVAIKRLHPHVAASPGALEMFIDEAKLSARVRHASIVATLDVVREQDELFLVMEYVHGVPLSLLERRAESEGERLPLAVVSAIMLDVLAGLDAVHRATDELGRPLAIVHRDVSPHNVLVGIDGTSRVLDFGIAKAAVRLQTTKDDRIKGKIRYMAPEQLMDLEVDGRTDQFAAGTVLWGMLTGQMLFDASNDAAVLARVLEGVILPPSRYAPNVPPALDAVVLRALARDPAARFPTCLAMSEALREAVPPASADQVRDCVERLAGGELHARAAQVAHVEAGLPPERAGGEVHSAEIATATATAAAPSPSERPRAPRVERARRGLLALALVGGLVGLVFVAQASGLGGALSGRAPSASALAVPSASTNAPPTPNSPAPEEGPSATVAAPPPPPSSGARTAASQTAPRGSHPPTRSHPAMRPSKSNCAKMYTVDSNGIRRVKPECL